MSSRTRARADARRSKKIENQLNFGHSASSSKTLIETCMEEIVRVTREALECKDLVAQGDIVAHLTSDESLDLRYERLKGQVNGLVWMYCKCWVNPYEPHLSGAVKAVRREAVKRARAQMAEEAVQG